MAESEGIQIEESGVSAFVDAVVQLGESFFVVLMRLNLELQTKTNILTYFILNH